MKQRGRYTVRTAALAVLLLAVTLPALATGQIYMSVESRRQGTFKGESAMVNGVMLSDQIPVLSVKHIATLGDKHNYGEITLVKNIDRASRQFHIAGVKNEGLTSPGLEIVITIVGDSNDGHAAKRLVLSNAWVHQFNRNGNHDTVTFTYTKVHVTYVNGDTSEKDDWSIQ